MFYCGKKYYLKSNILSQGTFIHHLRRDPVCSPAYHTEDYEFYAGVFRSSNRILGNKMDMGGCSLDLSRRKLGLRVAKFMNNIFFH